MLTIDRTGKLTASVKQNNLLEEIPLEQTGPYKFKLTFKPKTCGIINIIAKLID